MIEHTQADLSTRTAANMSKLKDDLSTEHRLAAGYKHLHDDVLIKLQLLSEQNAHLERELGHSQQQAAHLRTHLQQAEHTLSALRGSLSSQASELNHLRSFNVALDHADVRLRGEFDVSVTEHQRRMNELLERCNVLQAMKDRDEADGAIKVRELEKVSF